MRAPRDLPFLALELKKPGVSDLGVMKRDHPNFIFVKCLIGVKILIAFG